jgi:hypothetical protein
MSETDPGRDELIDARAEKERLLTATKTAATAIARLMEDRVRHMTALRQIAAMTETGIIAKGGADVHRIARQALDTEADMSWWPE